MILPLLAARAHLPPYSWMQRHGVVGAGDDAEWHCGAGWRLLVRVALPTGRPSLARGCDGESVVEPTAVLACWRDNESAAGWMRVLTCWRNNESATDAALTLRACGDCSFRVLCRRACVHLLHGALACAARSPAVAALDGGGGRGGAAALPLLSSRQGRAADPSGAARWHNAGRERRGEERGRLSIIPLFAARVHPPPCSWMQQCGIVRAGDDTCWLA